MTANDYFRNLVLDDYGFPADPKVIEFHNYITERLSNLNQYASDIYQDYVYYGKSKDEIFMEYIPEYNVINICDQNDNTFLFYSMPRRDIKQILCNYIENKYHINSFHIQRLYKQIPKNLNLKIIS